MKKPLVLFGVLMRDSRGYFLSSDNEENMLYTTEIKAQVAFDNVELQGTDKKISVVRII